MTRAVMEGVAFALRDGLEIMRGLGVPVDDVRATGAERELPVAGTPADVYGTLRTPHRSREEGPATARHSWPAWLWYLTPTWTKPHPCVERREEVKEPDPERVKAYEEHYEVYRSLYPATR
jgi:xylulokinase